MKAKSPPGLNSCIIFFRDSLYSGSCSKHSLETIVSKGVDNVMSFVLHTKFTLGASITSLLMYIQSVKRWVLFPLISPPPTSSTILLSKNSGNLFFTFERNRAASICMFVVIKARRDNESLKKTTET